MVIPLIEVRICDEIFPQDDAIIAGWELNFFDVEETVHFLLEEAKAVAGANYNNTLKLGGIAEAVYFVENSVKNEDVFRIGNFDVVF